MEAALRYELENNIIELKTEVISPTEIINHIYPTNAPEGVLKPYLVYARINTNKVKTLEGYTDKQALSYMFSIMATKYPDMVRIRKQVEDILVSLPGKSIGTQGIYVEDIDINNIDEQYEHNLGVNRGIIDFTIYY